MESCLILICQPKTFVLAACLVHVNGDMLRFCWTCNGVLSGRSLQYPWPLHRLSGGKQMCRGESGPRGLLSLLITSHNCKSKSHESYRNRVCVATANSNPGTSPGYVRSTPHQAFPLCGDGRRLLPSFPFFTTPFSPGTSQSLLQAIHIQLSLCVGIRQSLGKCPTSPTMYNQSLTKQW